MTRLNLAPYIRREPHEADFMRLVEQMVKPGWICVDVGCCQGDYTFLLAERASPGGQVYAFDIFPNNINHVKKIADQHNLTQSIFPLIGAITDGSQPTVEIFPGRGDSCYEWNLVGHDIDGNPTKAAATIPAASLDQVFLPTNTFPNLIKIDVEGAGAPILRGMQGLLTSSKPPIILMEFHNQEEFSTFRNLPNYQLFNTLDGQALTEPDFKKSKVFHGVALPETQRK